MARWQIVIKKSEATKQTKDQNNNNNKTKQKTTQNNKQQQQQKQPGFVAWFPFSWSVVWFLNCESDVYLFD